MLLLRPLLKPQAMPLLLRVMPLLPLAMPLLLRRPTPLLLLLKPLRLLRKHRSSNLLLIGRTAPRGAVRSLQAFDSSRDRLLNLEAGSYRNLRASQHSRRTALSIRS